MSSHFYLADRAACTNDADPAQCPPEDGVNYAGITPLELSTLWAIMERAEWDVKMMRLFPIVATFNIGERIIHEIPANVIERFATMSAEESGRVAQAWGATVEMSLRTDEVSSIVAELARLSIRAQATKRGFFLANRFSRH